MVVNLQSRCSNSAPANDGVPKPTFASTTRRVPIIWPNPSNLLLCRIKLVLTPHLSSCVRHKSRFLGYFSSQARPRDLGTSLNLTNYGTRLPFCCTVGVQVLALRIGSRPFSGTQFNAFWCVVRAPLYYLLFAVIRLSPFEHTDPLQKLSESWLAKDQTKTYYSMFERFCQVFGFVVI